MKANPIRILLVDDDKDDYLIIKDLLFEALRPKPELVWVSQYEDAVEEIEQGSHQVYLIDYRLGEKSGLDLLSLFDLQQRREPFIILTGLGDETVERQAVELGVADYLVKGKFEAELLRRVIEYSLQRKRLETQRVEHLVDLNRSKDEFIAITSHQLRTPATAVKQYLGILLGGYVGEMNEEQGSLIKRAYATNERQLKIVDDILRTAQLDLQKVELHPVNIEARQLVERCVQDVRLVVENRGQKITLDIPDEPITVTCDPAFMAMALGNLLDNASKYSDHGTQIRIEATRAAGSLKIKIIDQGVGIGKADVDKLFKKFSRIDNPLSVEVGGTGLGLYLVKAIISMHSGDITVDSKKDVGTTFTVTLPMAYSPRKVRAKVV